MEADQASTGEGSGYSSKQNSGNTQQKSHSYTGVGMKSNPVLTITSAERYNCMSIARLFLVNATPQTFPTNTNGPPVPLYSFPNGEFRAFEENQPKNEENV